MIDRELSSDTSEEFLKELFQVLGKVDYLDAKQVLYDVYETKFGLFNHLSGLDRKTRPLASVALHEMEDNTKSSSLYESIEIYLDQDINKNFGLSLNEFLDLPRELINKLLEVSIKKIQKDTNTLENVKNNLEQIKNKNKS